MDTPRDRLSYKPIINRPKLVLPDNARMVVWVIMNVEHWSSERAQPRTILPPPMGEPLLPDVPNWSWHEYGNRVGFWRLRDIFRKYGITPTLAMNGIIIESYRSIVEAALEDNWELMGHGYLQGPMHKLEDQRQHVRSTVEAIRDFSGKSPRGWESPGLTETMNTLEILAEEGIEYVADWPLDDQPLELNVDKGQIYSIPYPVETNDITMMALHHHSSQEFATRCIDQFDRLYDESADITRTMGISMHTYISGVPHRVKYVEQVLEYITAKSDVLIWTGE
ncbi:MAG: polysaccharide deacetylase family protein, partial [Pseudomonadota bacterium]|nr:polysaccharide deacetylase family protein [Pseudomonadota bacterium]